MAWCLYGYSTQDPGERRAQLETFRASLDPGEPEAESKMDSTPDPKKDIGAPGVQQVLQALADGAVDCVCFNDPNQLAQGEGGVTALESFLKEHKVGLIKADDELLGGPRRPF